MRDFGIVAWAVEGGEPIFDPTLYALDTISHNLDFSNRRMLAWLAKAGLEEYRQVPVDFGQANAL